MIRMTNLFFRIAAPLLGLAAGLAPAGAANAGVRLKPSDYAAVRAHPNDETVIAAFLAKLPTFEVQQDGVPQLYYVYEGDLLLTREEVLGAVRQRSNFNTASLVSPELTVNVIAGKRTLWPVGDRALTYAVDRASFANAPAGASYDEVVAALGSAAQEWVNACPGCGLSITHSAALDIAPQQGLTTFIVRYVPKASSVIALAFFPNDEPAKRYLYVFPLYAHTQADAKTNYDKVGVFRHELGHILGYRHEQIRKGAGCWQAESGEWQPLSPYDDKSVMHYYCGNAVSLKLRLTDIDIASHRGLYSGALHPSAPIEHGPAGAAAAGLADRLTPILASATASPPPLSAPPNISAVYISLIGGNIAHDLATVLNRLAEEPRLLPVEQVTIADGDNPSKLMKARGIPVAGAEFDALLDQLNGLKFGSRKLKVGDTIMLPKVTVTTRRTARTYTPEDRRQQIQKTDILKAWSKSKAAIEHTVNGLNRVEFDAYDVEIAFPSDAQTTAALRRLTLPPGQSLRSPNVVIDAELARPAPVKAYTFPEDYQPLCGAQPNAAQPPIVGYDELLDNDLQLDALLRNMPAPTAGPTVYVIDTKVTANPSLIGAMVDDGVAVGPPPAWRCNWTGFVEPLHHGTLLAGIIASRHNEGFIGLSPTSRISSFEWYRSDGSAQPTLVAIPRREHNLSMLIDDVTSQEGLSVFLIASEFKPFPPAMLDPESQLSAPGVRFQFTEAHKSVVANRPLLITAAGQSENDMPPVGLSETSPHSPQDLGDLENVVVVTACVICKHGSVTLHAKAFFGKPPDPIVHLAAPGGRPIAGWVDNAHVSQAPGTSPAAAYVAGVAAAMIARYPQIYREAKQIKERLQMTAWPILPTADPANTAWSKVAAGVVDYQRAQLDPHQTWIRDANGWRAVRVRRWSGPLRVNEDLQQNLADSKILRVLRLTDAGNDSEYAVFATTPPPRTPGMVRRFGPVTLADTTTALELCDGSSVPLSNLSELITATTVSGGPCD